MSIECPFSPQTVNAKAARLTAFLVVVLLLAGLFSRLNWMALLLCIDFFIRGFTRLPISPLNRAARALVKVLRLKPKPVNAGPKIFAAKIGFILSAAITVAAFCGMNRTAPILAEILVLAAGLEAFLGLCIGCHLYSLIQTLKRKLTSSTE